MQGQREVVAPAPIPGVELFAHGADIGVRGCGSSLEIAFANAALALTSVIVDPRRVGRTSLVEVHCEAPDLEMLLVRWLNEIVFEMSSRRMLFGHYEVELHESETGWMLRGDLTGERVDLMHHQPAVEVKGATFTELAVRDRGDGWCAQCVVDV
jgi:SHS2 domain-containing protein